MRAGARHAGRARGSREQQKDPNPSPLPRALSLARWPPFATRASPNAKDLARSRRPADPCPSSPTPKQTTTAARATATATATATTADCAPSTTGRAFAAAASGPKPEVIPNPLQSIVPPIITAISTTVRGVQKGLPAAYEGLISSGAAKSAVAWFADRALLSGYFLSTTHLDLPKWADFLSRGGYTDRAGWSKIIEGVRPAVEKGDLTAEEAEVLVAALHRADLYDKPLFSGLAAILRAQFTTATTEGLCSAIEAFAANGHFDAGLWDDAADSIAYCNHYLAPTKVPVATIASVFAAYAKYGCDRADLFVSLARALDEDRLRPLPDAELGKIATSLLQSFKTLDFWPDVTEALILAGRTRPGVSVDGGLAEFAAKKVAGGAAGGGGSKWLEGGYKDPEHFHGAAFGEYNMYVLRDELTPKYYSPAAARRDVEK